jgi:hypothetical protein
LEIGRDFSDEILDCCQFADECRRNADETDDPNWKQHYLDMEARWRHLASKRCIPGTNFQLQGGDPKAPGHQVIAPAIGHKWVRAVLSTPHSPHLIALWQISRT